MRVAAWLARIGIALCLLALTLLLLGLVLLPMVMGWSAYSVHTNDMAPTVPSGSQMYVRPPRGDEAITVKARDVIAYTPKTDPQDVVVKRVTRVDGEGAGRSWTVRGDANKEESVVRPDQLRGPVVLFVPYLGTIADLLAKQPLVMGGCLLGSLMLFSAMVLWAKHITAKRAKAADANNSGSHQLSDAVGRAPGGTRPPSAPSTMPPTPGTRPPVGGRGVARDPNGRPPSQSLPTVHDVPPPGTGAGAIIDSRPISGGQPVAAPTAGGSAAPATGSQAAAAPRTGSQPVAGPRTGSQPAAEASPRRPVPVAPPPRPDHAGMRGEDAHMAAWGQAPHPDGPRPLDDAAPPPPSAPAPARPAGAYVVAAPPHEGRGGYAPYTPQTSGYAPTTGAPVGDAARADDRRQYAERQAEDLRRFEEQRRAEEDYRRREEQRRTERDYPQPMDSWGPPPDDDPNKTELQRIFEAALRERGLPVPPPTSSTPIVQPFDRHAPPRDFPEPGRERAREQSPPARRPSDSRPSPVDDLSGPPTGFFLQVMAETGLGPSHRTTPPPRNEPRHDPRGEQRNDHRRDGRLEQHPEPRMDQRPDRHGDHRSEQRNDGRGGTRGDSSRGMDSLSLLESWRSYGEANPHSEAAKSLFPDDHATGWGSAHSGVQPQVGPDGLRTWGQPIVPELRPHAGYGNESRYVPEPPTKPPITGALRRISSTQYVFEDDPRTSGNSTTDDPDRSGPLSLFRRRQASSSDPKRGRRG